MLEMIQETREFCETYGNVRRPVERGNFYVEKPHRCADCQACREWEIVEQEHPLRFTEPNEIPSRYVHKEMEFCFTYDVDQFVKPINCPWSPFMEGDE